MMGELPSFYESILEMRVIAQAEGDQVDQLRADIADQLEQRFVSTVTWDLPAWEEELGIVPSAGQPIEQRRSVVSSKMRGYGKFSGRLLKTVAEAYANGEVNVRFPVKNLIPPSSDAGWEIRPGSNGAALGSYHWQIDPTANFAGVRIDVTNRVRGRSVTLSIENMTGTHARCYLMKIRGGVTTYHAIIEAKNGVFVGGQKAEHLVYESDITQAAVLLDNAADARGIHTFKNFQLEVGNLRVNDSYTDTLDFVGKVAGSTVENPHVAKRTAGGSSGSSAALIAPSGSWSTELSTAAYGNVAVLSDSVLELSNVGMGNISQMLYSFDLIEYVTHKYGAGVFGGAVTTADKVAWLNANVKTLNANWHGWGSGPRTNLLGVDGNFETDSNADGYADGWSPTGSYAEKSLSTDARFGTRSQRIKGSTFTALAHAVTGVAGKYYVAIADIKKLSADSLATTFRFSTDVNTHVAITSQILTQNVWTTVFVKYSGAFNQVQISQGNDPDYEVLIDGVCVYEVEQSTYNAIGTTITAANIRTQIGTVNKATLGGWNGANWNYYGVTHSQGIVAKLTAHTINPSTISDTIDANGFLHYLAYAPASDGITATTLRTDYIELIVGLQIPRYAGSFEERKDSTIGITFVSTRGVPPNLADIQSVLSDLIPAHLALEFYFTYVTFAELEAANLTFGDIEALGLTFGELEKYKP